MFLSFLAALALAAAAFLVYECLIAPSLSPLSVLPGPSVRKWFGNHLGPLLDPSRSPRTHEILVDEYGRSLRVRGFGPWDERFFTIDPLSMAHILKNTAIYEKPWQSRRLITRLIGLGILGAEGAVHKRQRRVATPAFSAQNMRALVPLVFRKGRQLRDKWSAMIVDAQEYRKDAPATGEAAKGDGIVLDVAGWISRATFDIIGLAGFDYSFNSIEDESNELFAAYKDMFEVAISQTQTTRTMFAVYFPLILWLFPDKASRIVTHCQGIIHRVAGQLIQEKKRKIEEGKRDGKNYMGKDLLTLLLKSNEATDLPVEQRISDEDILNNINTFLFAGSDTTSLGLTWTLLLLARNQSAQDRLRAELLSILPESGASLDSLTEDEMQSLYTAIADLPFLDNVCRESLRLIPPVHSSLRVATQDDVVPTSYPVMTRRPNGVLRDSGARSVLVPKGTYVHIPIEAFHLDRGIWGADAWDFNPDRWDNLPEAVESMPGLFSNLLTFSGGPRSCIGMRFSMIEMKTVLYVLLTSFTFAETDDKIFKANVILTRPYIKGKFKQGSQCPLRITPYVR